METFKVKVELVSTVVITVTAENAKEAMNKVDQMDPDQIIDSGYFLSCDVTEMAVLQMNDILIAIENHPMAFFALALALICIVGSFNESRSVRD